MKPSLSDPGAQLSGARSGMRGSLRSFHVCLGDLTTFPASEVIVL